MVGKFVIVKLLISQFVHQLTGHLVLSTLHTNDAPGAITRLIDMEIEPFLIASSVEMVIAQRLNT